jgi:hypothetical protein
MDLKAALILEKVLKHNKVLTILSLRNASIPYSAIKILSDILSTSPLISLNIAQTSELGPLATLAQNILSSKIQVLNLSNIALSIS